MQGGAVTMRACATHLDSGVESWAVAKLNTSHQKPDIRLEIGNIGKWSYLMRRQFMILDTVEMLGGRATKANKEKLGQ